MAQSLEAPVKALLANPNFASVATIRKDGTPQVVVVWVDADGDDVLLNTAEGRGWHNNLQRDPRITITVPNKDNPYEFMSVTGTVVEETREGANEHIDALAKKYLGLDEYPMHKPGEERTTLRIRPERVYHQAPPPS
jgi:PPOX class probable F420-dependent enzyme